MGLKELLGEELAAQVQEKLGENHKLIDTKEGAWLPKEKFDQVNNDNKELKTQLQTRDQQLDEVGKKVKDSEELTKVINELKTQNEQSVNDYQTKLDKQAFDFALERTLASSKAKNPKAVRGLLELDKLKLDGDKILGIDDQLKTIKEDNDFLFEPEKNIGNPSNPAVGGGGDPNDPQDFRNLSDADFKDKMASEYGLRL